MQIPDSLAFDPATLTWNQAVWLGDFTGRTAAEMAQIATDGSYTPRDAAGLACLVINPTDPAAAWEQLRTSRITDFQIDR